MPDFSIRSVQQEIMDDLNCSGQVVDQTLRELEIINRWLGGNEVTIDGVQQLLNGYRDGDKLTIADLGCGGGDMLKLLSRWSVRRGVNAEFLGIDANPNIITFARNSNWHPSIRYAAMNIFSDTFRSMQFDIAVATLFFHHFTSEELIKFFRQLKSQARIGFVINDIHRHWFSYYSIGMLTKWFSKSPMVKFDAPLSVLRAFSKAELMAILREAGVSNYTIRWRWAFRWQIVVRV